MHIALTCVESDTFREWVLYVAPGLEVYLVKSANNMKIVALQRRRWGSQCIPRKQGLSLVAALAKISHTGCYYVD
jgi:hypothetical protein